MYINFEKLYSLGLTADMVFTLQSIKQRDEVYIEANRGVLPTLIEKGYVDVAEKGKNSTGAIRISQKGAAVIDSITIPHLADKVMAISRSCISMYDQYQKKYGTLLEINRRISWFVANTAFSEKVIKDAVEEHLQQTQGGEYTMTLENLFWKPLDIRYSTNMTLAQSKLFDIIIKKYNHNLYYYDKKNRNKKVEYLFQLSKLDVPQKGEAEYSLTGDWGKDRELIQRAKIKLQNLLTTPNDE